MKLDNDFSGNRLVFYDENRSENTIAPFMEIYKEMNRESLLDFLLFGSILPPHSPLRAVSQLYPGEHVENGVSVLAYQDKQLYRVAHKTLSEFVDEFDCCIEAQMNAHPETGTILLSGGIDSAILLSYLPAGATCLTWGGRGAETSDVIYSRMTAARYGVKNHCFVYADYERDLEMYKEAVRTLKVPMLFSGAVPYLRMAEEGKAQGISSWFMGQNADTLFMSYPAPVLTKRLSLVNTFLPFNPLGLSSSRKRYLLSTPSMVRLLAYFKSCGVFPGEWLGVPESYFEEKEEIIRSLPTRNSEQRIIAIEELLTESRRNQICQNEIPALSGITARCPYYDRSLIELALSVPPALRKQGRYGKVILKELAKKRGVPESVIYKQKSGLSYGLDSFMTEKRHLPIWDAMEEDPDLNALINVPQIRAEKQDNYYTFVILSSLHYWFELVARPQGLRLPEIPLV